MRRESLFLGDIIRACDKVANYIADGKLAFESNEMIQDAVIRNLEIIGEAAKNLSPELRTTAIDQPWRQIAGMRDKLIHHYFGINLDRVWETASAVLPPFRDRIAQLLAEHQELDPGSRFET